MKQPGVLFENEKEHEPWLVSAALVQGKHKDLRLMHLQSSSVSASCVQARAMGPHVEDLGWGYQWLSFALLLTKKKKGCLEGVKLFRMCKCCPFQLFRKDSVLKQQLLTRHCLPVPSDEFTENLLKPIQPSPWAGSYSIWGPWEQQGPRWGMVAGLALCGWPRMPVHQQPQLIMNSEVINPFCYAHAMLWRHVNCASSARRENHRCQNMLQNLLILATAEF